MAKTLPQILSKLDKPPAAHNWTLCNHQTQARTTSSLVNLAMGFPTVSYQWALAVIQNVVADNLNEARAIQNLLKICPPSQQQDNLDLLNAFLNHHAQVHYEGIRVFDEFAGQFHAGPDVVVPVRPTVILNKNGILKPLFVIGWATNSLKYYQRRLLASLYDDAIYSLTDLRNSPGEVLLFPKNGYGIRHVEQWNRNSYQLLSKDEIREQVQRFTNARDEARPIIADRFRRRAEQRAQDIAMQRQARAERDSKRP